MAISNENSEKVRKLERIREEFLWSENKMYGRLCATYHKNLFRTYIVIHVGTNDLSSKEKLAEVLSEIVDLRDCEIEIRQKLRPCYKQHK